MTNIKSTSASRPMANDGREIPPPAPGLADAGHLRLISRIDNRTGASVGMWSGIQCAPIEWGAMLANGSARDQ